MADVQSVSDRARRALGREYELVYILQPQVDPDEADKVANKVVEVLGKVGGTITKVDQWGKRRLAYPITRFSRGIFVYVRFAGIGDVVSELERNLRNADAVIRFQTVRVEGTTVDLDALTVDPEAVKFERVEQLPGDEEVEPSFEERLGLTTRARERDMSDEVDTDMDDDDDIPTRGAVRETPSDDDN